jgi:hypothetical protein
MSSPDRPLADVVAEATDTGALGATVSALLLEVQAQLGLLSALAVQLTERGRLPFRPAETWTDAIAQLSFSVFNLADQTGVNLDAVTRELAHKVIAANTRASAREPATWPVGDA